MSATSRRLLIAVAAGVAVFAAFSVHADVQELGDRMAGFGWWALAAALALAALNYAIRFARWQIYLRRIEVAVPVRTSALVFLSGFALSVTPGKVGELIKSYLLREAHQIPIARTAPVVVAERVTDLAALLLLGLAGVAAFGVGREMLAGGAAVLVAGLIGLSWPALARAGIRFATWPRPLRRFRESLLGFHAGLADLIRPWPLSWATALGAVAWLAECIGFALVCAAFPGAQVPLGLAIAIYACTTLAGALSFLPGGLLVTEAAMTLLLVQSSTGMDQPTAVAATIVIRLATLWFAVAIGVVALAVLRRRAPQIRHVLAQSGDPDRPAPG